MLASPVRLLAALAAVLLSAPACGGDDEIVNDGEPPAIDSGVPDAGIDAENLCPGAVTFEAFAANLESGSAEFDVAVTEVGNPSNTESSAPNGRVVICLPEDTDLELSAEKTDYLTRVDALPSFVVGQFSPSTLPYPLFVIAEAAADTLYSDLGTTFMAPDGQVVVSVVEYPAGTPLEGATVEIDKADTGQFTRDESGGFADGNAIAGGGLVLFANVPLAGGDVEITVTPPDSFRGNCIGPTALALAAGQMSGALFTCQ